MKRFLGIEQKKQIRETNVWLKNKGVQLSTDMRKSISVEICKPNINKNTKMTQNLNKFEKEIEEIKRIELENTTMIKIGTEVKIIDNFYEHLGYVKDSIVKIIEHDECGNYILSSGHCCSELEIEIIKTI